MDVIVATNSVSLEQLKVRHNIQFSEHVVEIVKISAANCGKPNLILRQTRKQKLKQFTKYYMLPQLEIKTGFHVLTDIFDFAVRAFCELVNIKCK